MRDALRSVAIIQARMGSTRLPDKVLMDIGGRSMLERVVRRVGRAQRVDETLVATTSLARDDAIASACERLGVPIFRGDEDDVLDRYHNAAVAAGAEVVVRITADCPLIDPQVIDQVIEAFFRERPDYASNTVERSYPRGLDTEVFSVAALERAWREARAEHERVHVTPYLFESPGRFRVVGVRGERDLSDQRWTVDTEDDLRFLREIYARLGGDDSAGWRKVLELLEQAPELLAINRDVHQKELGEG